MNLCNIGVLLFPSFSNCKFYSFHYTEIRNLGDTNLRKICEPILRFSDSECLYFPVPKSENWEFENSWSLLCKCFDSVFYNSEFVQLRVF